MPKPSIGKRKKKKPTSFEVPRSALEIWRFAGDEDSRSHLHPIHFESEKIGKSVTVHALATDGHRLIHTSWTAKEDDHIEDHVDVSSSAVRDFLKYVGRAKKSYTPIFRINEEGSEHVLGTDRGHVAKVGFTFPDSARFPDWRHVIPKPLSGTNRFPQRFGVNLAYLVDFGKYLHVCGSTQNVIFHYASEKALDPIRLEPAGLGDEINAKVEVEYILMPVRT
jgi:DNA polymerase III sliding clamp (beta) subunit (PCNA family)